MTTRQELYQLIDQVPVEELDTVASLVVPFTNSERPPLPQSLGMGDSGRGDVSERADEVLRETGFGQ